MTRLDPSVAPPRSDLPFLRTRSRPRATPAAPPAAAPPARAASPDLSTPTPVRPSSSLDLGSPPSPPPQASSSLDLSVPVAPKAARPKPAPRRRVPVRRAPSATQTLLSARTPAVTLTRLQSAIGALRVEAACSAAVGDLRLGCAYQLSSGTTSTVQRTGGNRVGPPDSHRPVLRGQKDEYETVLVDLRLVQEVRRLTFFAYSERRVPLAWGGTLVAQTYGHASVEVPLELPSSPVAVLLSAYNVGGELVLRREMLPVQGTVKQACLLYGYDRITWLDDWTPIS